MLCSDEQIELKIDSRPNVGDGIYFRDLHPKKISGFSREMKKHIEDSTRFVVSDVVYGTIGIFTKPRWIIQGEMEE